MSASHTTLHASGSSPADHAIRIEERRRSWFVVVQLAPCGRFLALASTPGYQPLREYGVTGTIALVRIRETVDAFDEMLGRGEGGGL